MDLDIIHVAMKVFRLVSRHIYAAAIITKFQRLIYIRDTINTFELFNKSGRAKALGGESRKSGIELRNVYDLRRAIRIHKSDSIVADELKSDFEKTFSAPYFAKSIGKI